MLRTSPLVLTLTLALGCQDKPGAEPAPAAEPAADTATAKKPPADPPAPPSSGADKPVTTADPRIARAQAALLPLKKSLQGALKGAMAEGPETAVKVCNTKAMPLTEAAEKNGVKLGRTSHKLRNPNNAPADWMRPLYAKLQEAEAGVPYLIAELPDGSFGYLEPIVTQPLCLTCHGSDVPPAVKKVLAEKYPKDEARGFAAGQLRGAWWAVLPVSTSDDAKGESGG